MQLCDEKKELYCRIINASQRDVIILMCTLNYFLEKISTRTKIAPAHRVSTHYSTHILSHYGGLCFSARSFVHFSLNPVRITLNHSFHSYCSLSLKLNARPFHLISRINYGCLFSCVSNVWDSFFSLLFLSGRSWWKVEQQRITFSTDIPSVHRFEFRFGYIATIWKSGNAIKWSPHKATKTQINQI